ncbi:MAG: hypothetical protein LBK83_14350, partial [Treponema sp.]|nr:hypothetical protein [Treponema sp.]
FTLLFLRAIRLILLNRKETITSKNGSSFITKKHALEFYRNVEEVKEAEARKAKRRCLAGHPS